MLELWSGHSCKPHRAVCIPKHLKPSGEQGVVSMQEHEMTRGAERHVPACWPPGKQHTDPVTLQIKQNAGNKRAKLTCSLCLCLIRLSTRRGEGQMASRHGAIAACRLASRCGCHNHCPSTNQSCFNPKSYPTQKTARQGQA